jgi:NADPH:quinone reductase-like Zn-dependent oxidoreductase
VGVEKEGHCGDLKMSSASKVAPAGDGKHGKDGIMKAVYVNAWCAPGTVPDKISVGEIAAPPAPTKAEVLVGIEAASINVDDVALLQNTAAGGWFFHTRKPTAQDPLVGGMDYAGVVLACGPDCKRLKEGDRVCGIIKPLEYQRGTWAEQTLAPEAEVCLIEDDSISFVEASAVAMGAFVNFDMVKHAAKVLEAGNCRCLVIGASGALGTVMLHILKRKYGGCHVTAVCSGKNADVVKKLGADQVVDYTKEESFGEQLTQQGAQKFDVVFDFIGGTHTQRAAEPLLERGGLYITAVGDRQNVGDRVLSCCEWTGSCCYMVRAAICQMLCGCAAKYKYVMSGSYPPLTAEIWKSIVLDAGARAAIAEEVQTKLNQRPQLI